MLALFALTLLTVVALAGRQIHQGAVVRAAQQDAARQVLATQLGARSQL